MAENIQPIKLPIITTIFGCYKVLADKFKEFISLGSIFAVILTVLYIVTGQNAFCISGIYRMEHFCTDNIILFAVTHIISLMVLCIFLRCWYQNILLGLPLNWKKFFIPQKTDLKIMAIIGCYVISLVIAGFSVYLLYQRIPNPDWRIEICYFAIISLGVWVPFLALRFLSSFAYVAEEITLPSLKDIWKQTSGNMFKILLFITMLMLLSVILSQSLFNKIINIENTSFFMVIAMEYLSNLLVIFIIACFTNYCYLQKQLLSERN